MVSWDRVFRADSAEWLGTSYKQRDRLNEMDKAIEKSTSQRSGLWQARDGLRGSRLILAHHVKGRSAL